MENKNMKKLQNTQLRYKKYTLVFDGEHLLKGLIYFLICRLSIQNNRTQSHLVNCFQENNSLTLIFYSWWWQISQMNSCIFCITGGWKEGYGNNTMSYNWTLHNHQNDLRTSLVSQDISVHSSNNQPEKDKEYDKLKKTTLKQIHSHCNI